MGGKAIIRRLPGAWLREVGCQGDESNIDQNKESRVIFPHTTKRLTLNIFFLLELESTQLFFGTVIVIQKHY